ncbi:MAG: hypothetical protein HN731_04145 [Rhodospirillaceae bacterium]|nr:hypothetical protein [Rhodospirillaceae bacterium]
MRQHSEKIKPPRALYCPFELGRPFGAPNEPEFQKRVLTETLKLLERTDGPILDDFPDGPPGPATDDDGDIEGWTCPVNFGDGTHDISVEDDPLAALNQEIELMRSWYEMFVEKNNKTSVGISEVDFETCIKYLVDFISDKDTPPPRTDIPRYNMLKLATDEMKAYYFEAGLARPGLATDKELADWYYGETTAGKVLLKVNEACANSGDEVLKGMSDRRIIPIHQQHLKQQTA